MLKNVTLSADGDLISRARERALREKSTLNRLFRQWLRRYLGDDEPIGDFQEIMERLSYAKAPRKFTRDEMNER